MHPSLLLGPDADKTSPSSATVTILVVDDDVRVRNLTARMLRSEGYNVLEAGSGEEALEALTRAGDVRVILTDILMPGMHGIDLAESILASYPDRRIVLMTGYAPSLLVQLGIRQAPFPLLIKPFSAEQLAWQMREVLGGHEH